MPRGPMGAQRPKNTAIRPVPPRRTTHETSHVISRRTSVWGSFFLVSRCVYISNTLRTASLASAPVLSGQREGGSVWLSLVGLSTTQTKPQLPCPCPSGRGIGCCSPRITSTVCGFERGRRCKTRTPWEILWSTGCFQIRGVPRIVEVFFAKDCDCMECFFA